jgi:hypothetical protein
VWNCKTKRGTHKTKYGDIDYYAIFDLTTGERIVPNSKNNTLGENMTEEKPECLASVVSFGFHLAEAVGGIKDKEVKKFLESKGINREQQADLEKLLHDTLLVFLK